MEAKPDANNAAEPSAAATSAIDTFDPADQKTWSPEQREHWNRTGEQPVKPTKAESESASAPENTAKPEPHGKSAAESGAAPKQEKKTGKLSADERISQLTAERNALEDRLKAIEETQRASKTGEKPEPKPETKKAEPLKRPNPFTWAGTPEEYEKAVDAYEKQQREIAIAEYLQRQAMEEAAKEMKQQMTAARELYPDADSRIIPATKTILEDQKIPSSVKALIEGSDVVVHLMYTLGEPAKLAEFVEKAKTKPGEAIRELVVLETLVKEELAKKKSSSDVKPKASPESGSTEKKEAPAEPVKPRNPKPVTEIGGRGAAPPDAAETAAKEGNFRNFEAEMNRRLRAQAKA